MDLDVGLGNDILGKGAVLVLHRIAAVHEARDSVAFLEMFADTLADLFDRAGVVAADERAWAREEVDVFPVGRVEGDGGGFDEDVAVAEVRDRTVRDELGVFGALDHNGFLGGGHFGWLWLGTSRGGGQLLSVDDGNVRNGILTLGMVGILGTGEEINTTTGQS